MKKHNIIFAILLAALGITIFIGFNFIDSLKWQNNTLSVNIGQITKRIAALELDKTMAQISALKARNTALKNEIDSLRVELSRITRKITQPSGRQLKQEVKKEEPVLGNRGFLLKDSQPVR